MFSYYEGLGIWSNVSRKFIFWKKLDLFQQGSPLLRMPPLGSTIRVEPFYKIPVRKNGKSDEFHLQHQYLNSHTKSKKKKK